MRFPVSVCKTSTENIVTTSKKAKNLIQVQSKAIYRTLQWLNPTSLVSSIPLQPAQPQPNKKTAKSTNTSSKNDGQF